MISFHNTISLQIKVLFFCFLCVAWSSTVVFCQEALEVEVSGIEGKFHKNVMSRLRINLYSRDSSLNKAEVTRLHGMAEADIASALAPYGYYSVTVKDTLDETIDGWKARYNVQLGEPTRISSMSVSVIGPGKDLEEFANPAALLGVKTDEILDQPLYEKGKKKLVRTARSLGFLDADLTIHEIRILTERHEAEIELVMNTGPRYLFGDTLTEQDIITDKLLFRFLPYEKGDFYSSTKLYKLQSDLYRTDYFGRVVVEGGTIGKDGNYVPVTIHLEPHEKYNRYSFGVGYATDTRFHTLFEWKNKSFNSKGHRVDASFLVGELESHCNVGYRIPVVDPRYNTVAFSGTWNREKWEEITTSLLSAGTAFDYHTPAVNYGTSLELRNENYTVGNTSGKSLILMPLVYWSWALADNVVSTTNGFRATVTVSGAAEDIVSDVSFIKGRADGKLILTPIEGWRLIGRGTVGGIYVDSINEIPPSLRFYAGGAKSVRGYRYRTLGPTDDSDALVGGSFLLSGSIEGEYKINDYLRTFVFYDAGNAMDDLSVELVHGVGAGIGLVLPFGHVRLEFAYPLNNEGDAQYFYLSVGADL